MKLIKNTRAQASAASATAALIALITILAILYILALPPEERAKILGEKQPGEVTTGLPGATGEKAIKSVILKEAPGRIEFFEERERKHPVPTLQVYISKEGRVLSQRNSMLAEKGLIKERRDVMSFKADSPDDVDNLLLSFSVLEGIGNLEISLNDNQIFNQKVIGQRIIVLPKEFLSDGANLLKFSVSSPGIRFYRTNLYNLADLKVTADVLNRASQKAEQAFFVDRQEKDSLARAVLRFLADCRDESGRLKITINGFEVFNAKPDCNLRTGLELNPEDILAGSNRIGFEVNAGSYIVDQISVDTQLESADLATYFFNLDKDLFVKRIREVCGDADGVCPIGCDEDVDIDCCFDDDPNNLWCDIEASDVDDRCVGFVDSNNAGKCASGYEDEDGEIAEIGKGNCGDDNDDICPAGCKAIYDKDCCFETDGFWCDTLPTTGADSICVKSLGSGSCAACLTGYESEDKSVTCPIALIREEEDKLLDRYDVVLELRFLDDFTRKEGKIIINGDVIGFSTKDDSYEVKIDQFVEAGGNAIKIIPEDEIDVADLEVRLES